MRSLSVRGRNASQIIRAQMNLLFLSGVEVPDPEKIVMNALAAIDVPEMPELAPNPSRTRAQPGRNRRRGR